MATQQSTQTPATAQKSDPLSGFTDGAIDMLKDSVERFRTASIERAKKLAEIDRQENFESEITTQHVKAAIDRLAGPIARTQRPKWYIAAVLSEYVLTLVAGIGAGNLKDDWGVLSLSLGGLAAIAIMSLRHIYAERDR